MKKVMMFCLGALMVACPAACINDPTDSQQVCPGTETGTDCLVEDTDTATATVCSNGQITDAVTQLCVDATETVVDTSTETVVE